MKILSYFETFTASLQHLNQFYDIMNPLIEIVKLRQGSGKDRQGMARDGP